MRIAVIGTRGGGPARDGIDKALAEICPRLVQRGHSIDLYSERNGRSLAAAPGARMIRLPAMPTGFGDSSHAVLSSLWSAVRGYDVVNFMAADSAGLFTLASKFGLHRTVVSVHGLERPASLALSPPFGPESVAARFADVITVVSRRLERFFRDAYGRDTIYIPNGVEAAPPAIDPAPISALGLEPGEYVLFADRLVAQSGAHMAVRTINALPPGRKLVVAELGDGDAGYRQHLWQEADHDRILFLGRVDNPLLDALMAHAYLYVLPSDSDVVAPTLLQALAHGRAVVVSDQPEYLDLVGADAFTFTSGEVADLKRVLMWLLADPDAVANMRIRAAATARERYNWDRIAEAYEQVYASIV